MLSLDFELAAVGRMILVATNAFKAMDAFASIVSIH
jgi:hypothetical protein